jgi:hypothetical protein
MTSDAFHASPHLTFCILTATFSDLYLYPSVQELPRHFDDNAM